MKTKNEGTISSWKIAATYIGTVVGAGFASGQEVLQFFGYFGVKGILGLVIVTVLFSYFGRIILSLGRKLKADSHTPIIYYAVGSWLGRFIDYVITFFLFGALTAMAAGAGAIFLEQFGFSPIIGNALMIAVTLGTVLFGLGGVITAISMMVPLLLVSVLGISIYTAAAQGYMDIVSVPQGKPAVPFWPLAAVVYVSYNLIMSVAILGPLGKAAQDEASLRRGALMGGLGLGLGALSILAAILVTLPESAGFAIPMIYISGLLSPLIQKGYSLILLSEIYTTAVGSLYGFAARFATPQQQTRFRYVAVGASITAFAASQFGFTNLVRILYPLVGYAGLVLLGGLIYIRVTRTSPRR